jgi:poly(hydroxyalkanoate) depolymerase family esterase
MSRMSSPYEAWSSYVWSCWQSAFLLPPASLSAAGRDQNWQKHWYSTPSGKHPYFVYTPLKYQPGTAVPLIVMLHGCTQTPADFAAGTAMNLLADQHQFIVAYPQQTSAGNSHGCWNWFDPAHQTRGRGEPARIAGIVETMMQSTSQWTIDRQRIYIVGFSAGAAMAVILGATYPDLFAAIGLHSGFAYQAGRNLRDFLMVSRLGGPNPMQQRHAIHQAMGSLARVVPTIVFHGARDTLVSPINGDQLIQQWLHTTTLASQGRDSLAFEHPASTRTEKVPGGHTYTIYTWQNSHGTTIHEYWKIAGMGHAWSGGSSRGSYTDSHGPNASRAMYQFFLKHALRQVPDIVPPTRHDGERRLGTC